MVSLVEYCRIGGGSRCEFEAAELVGVGRAELWVGSEAFSKSDSLCCS